MYKRGFLPPSTLVSTPAISCSSSNAPHVYFSDFADNCYTVAVEHEVNGFAVSISKEPLKERKIIKYPQKLFTYTHNDVKTS